MRWALIQAGRVANVVEQDSAPSIPGQWVACGSAGPGWSYDGAAFAAPAVAAIGIAVSMRQARLALLAAGKLSAVEAAINAMNEPTKTQARISWDYASEVRRDGPMLAPIASAIGLTESQIDDLFAAAAAIP